MTPALKIQRLRAEDGSLPPMPARATEGAAGFDRMQAIMQAFRGDIAAFGGKAGGPKDMTQGVLSSGTEAEIRASLKE